MQAEMYLIYHIISLLPQLPVSDKIKTASQPEITKMLFWYARLDSNQRPSESESDALSNCATGAYQNDMNLWGSAIFQNSGQIVVNGEGNFPLHWLEATDCKGLRRFAADRT